QRVREGDQTPRGAKNSMVSGPAIRQEISAFLYDGRERIEVGVDTENFLASALNEFAFVPKARGRVLHEVDGVGALPFVFALIGAPLDEAGPAGQRCQMAREIVLPSIRRN